MSLEVKGEDDEAIVLEAESEPKPSGVIEVEDFESNSKVVALGSRGMRIRERLEEELSPVELEVEDVSHQHAGHAGVRGSAGADGETHFSLRVVSDAFQARGLVKRHRMVYDLLQEELLSGLHALSIVAKTPAEV
ncbi:hypothetical protein HID58_078247 [Brassica napus]|uniref:Bola-like protein n=1 Tax=Brassica napus TaxID=3708 RepID=A0ABQ7YSM8_BRANA|nr:sufE-like protein 1, chloroplastic/mitochondrial [Brassica napus]KAH0871225.1 hypothetical protein HID58_078247 [Brassica napus]